MDIGDDIKPVLHIRRNSCVIFSSANNLRCRPCANEIDRFYTEFGGHYKNKIGLILSYSPIEFGLRLSLS